MDDDIEVLFDEHPIRVVREDGVVRLEAECDENVYSVYDESNLFSGGYWDYISVLAYLAGEVSDVFVAGLGGGTVVRQLTALFNPRIDVAEVDERMMVIARDFFALKEDARLSFHVAGAARFLVSVKKFYDVIVVDAFVGDMIPGDINSGGFFMDCAGHLNPDGILIVNSIVDEKHVKEAELLSGNIKSCFTSSFTAGYDDNLIYFAFKKSADSRQVKRKLNGKVDGRLKETRDRILKNLKKI